MRGSTQEAQESVSVSGRNARELAPESTASAVESGARTSWVRRPYTGESTPTEPGGNA